MGSSSLLAFRAGAPAWIWICAAGGAVVGLLKAIVRLDEYPSFITELKHQQVDSLQSVKVIVCCVATLCAGASLGLEAGLGAAGAVLGQELVRLVEWLSPDEARADTRRRIYILSGMAAAFGAILPTPAIAVLLVYEVSTAGTEQHMPAREFMSGRRLSKKVVIFLVPAAVAAFTV